MMTPTPPPRSEPDRWSTPVFPQPVRGFAGRRGELDRMLAHLEHDTLFLVYGVGGIGKSELVYQLLREARTRPRWDAATPVLLELRPGATAPRALAQLLAAVGAAPAPRRGQPTEQAHLSEQLELLAHRLEARPFLVFIDDAHHLPAATVAEALGYLARRVATSRLVVASRRELALPPAAPPPVVTTLGPLDAVAAAAMAAALAERLQVPTPEPDAMMQTTHGSPFHIHQLLRLAPGTGSLDASLAELTPDARRVLRAVATAQHRPSVEVLRRASPDPDRLEQTLAELARRFLIDRAHGRVGVHDLIREALLGASAADEQAAAHADAAALIVDELAAGDRPPLLAVDAAGHYLAAGRPAEAWAVIERWHGPLAAAGDEHLLSELLERLRAALPARAVAIDLLIARGLVRASLFEEAGRVLARTREARTPAEAARHCVLAGEVAQQAGDLARAEALFVRAVALAPDPDARFQGQLRIASAATFADDAARARQVLTAALAALPRPTPRQRARAAWTRTVSWMVEERFEQAATEARAARLALAGAGQDDLINQLAMLETLACIEHEDMVHARAAARVIDEAGSRQRVASLYRAIVRYADGEARAASVELRAAHAHMRAHGDTINEYLADYYGGAALSEIGELGQAQVVAERAWQLAHRAGLRGQAARSRAQQALFAADAVQSGLAHRLAAEALASPQIGPRARARAHCAHARAYAIEGELPVALDHVAQARLAVAAPELAAARAVVDVEEAAIGLTGGDFDRAVELTERALAHDRGRARIYEASRAQLVLAAALVARARRTDLLSAGRAIALARELADRGHLRPVQVGCAILSAALARRGQRDRAAGEVLAEALRELDPERGSLHAGALMAAIDGGAIARAVPGVVALLAHLGFREAIDGYLVDRQGRRAATDKDLARARATHELFVDERRAVIVARQGAVEIKGRPMLCALLAVLVQARGAPVSPEVLYQQAWGVATYHPLQHRNALYVAINRLRSCLREILPGREVIERASTGWRLVDDVDACAAVAAPR